MFVIRLVCKHVTRLDENKCVQLPVLWRHRALRGRSPVSVYSVPMVWPQLFIQSHHVPLLSTVPRLADLLDLSL